MGIYKMNDDYMMFLAMVSVLTFVAAIVYIIYNATARELEARAKVLDALARIMNAANESSMGKGETENE